MTLAQQIAQEPAILKTWVYWLMLINSLSIFFAFSRPEAHWALTAWLANLLIMPAIYDQLGYVRLLGASHILVWTPLLAYLYVRRAEISWNTISGKYLYILFVSNAVSLGFDYVDLFRYVAGDTDLG